MNLFVLITITFLFDMITVFDGALVISEAKSYVA